MPQVGKALLKSCYEHALLYGAHFFGLSNGTICNYGSYTTNLLINGPPVSNDQCSMTCGNQNVTFADPKTKTKCGGTMAISIYEIQNIVINKPYMVNATDAISKAKLMGLTGSYVYVGCYVDYQYNLVRNHVTFTPIGSYGKTMCEASAKAAHAKFYGLEYGDKCIWGNTQSLTMYGPQQTEIACTTNRCGNYNLLQNELHLDGSASQIACGSNGLASMYQLVSTYKLNLYQGLIP